MIIMRHGIYIHITRAIRVASHTIEHAHSRFLIQRDIRLYIFLRIIHVHLRVQVAVDVVLLVPEAIHGDPEAERLHLGPHARVPLADPRLDEPLLLNVGRRVVPAAEPVAELASVCRECVSCHVMSCRVMSEGTKDEERTYIWRSGVKPYSSSTVSMSASASSCRWLREIADM
jgi:hypothetical protein